MKAKMLMSILTASQLISCSTNDLVSTKNSEQLHSVKATETSAENRNPSVYKGNVFKMLSAICEIDGGSLRLRSENDRYQYSEFSCIQNTGKVFDATFVYEYDFTRSSDISNAAMRIYSETVFKKACMKIGGNSLWGMYTNIILINKGDWKRTLLCEVGSDLISYAEVQGMLKPTFRLEDNFRAAIKSGYGIIRGRL